MPSNDRGLRNAVDGGQNRVHLQLIGADFIGAEPAGVGGLTDQTLKLGQQRADFVQATFGGSDNIAGKAGIVDRGLDAGLFLLKTPGWRSNRRDHRHRC